MQGYGRNDTGNRAGNRAVCFLSGLFLALCVLVSSSLTRRDRLELLAMAAHRISITVLSGTCVETDVREARAFLYAADGPTGERTAAIRAEAPLEFSIGTERENTRPGLFHAFSAAAACITAYVLSTALSGSGSAAFISCLALRRKRETAYLRMMSGRYPPSADLSE